MGTRSTYDARYALAVALAAVLIIAAGIPLYLSGTPKLRADTVAATNATALALVPTRPPVVVIPPHPTATPTQRPAATRTPVSTATAQPTATDADLASAVKAVLAGQPGVYGVVIASADGTPEYSQNADVPFESASLYKLVLLADIYAKIEQGAIAADLVLPILPEYYPAADQPNDSYFDPDSSPDSVPIDQALFAAGAYSSNVAARALLSLTDDASLRATALSLGMTETYFEVDPSDLGGWPPSPTAGDAADQLREAVAFVDSEAESGPIFLTTPRDIATYFQKLLAGKVVDQAVSGLILGILKQQAVDDRFPCLLPDGTELAHKTGNLDHVVHDAGIIWNGDEPIILVAMVEASDDDLTASELIQQLALVAYDKDDDPMAAAQTDPDPNCGVDEPTPTPSDDESGA